MVFNMFINKLDFLHELSNLLGTAPADEQGEVVRDPELPSANQLVHVEGVEAVTLHHVVGQLVHVQEGDFTCSTLPRIEIVIVNVI